MARHLLAATAVLMATVCVSGLYTDSVSQGGTGVPSDRELFSRIGDANLTQVATSRALSRKRRFFAPLPAGATFILTPKFTMPLPGLAPGGSLLNVEVPLSFALPTAAADDEATYKSTDESGDSYTYYRSLDQEQADMYSYAENFISQFGLDGKTCILRTICEVAETPVQDAGMMGEIFNTVLRTTVEPSEGERLQEYRKAEERGKAVGRCDEYYSACPVSVFKLM